MRESRSGQDAGESFRGSVFRGSVLRNDEFVFGGNDVVARILARERTGHAVVPEPAPRGHHVSVILDSSGTISRSADGLVFDPSGSHYGHSMKLYADAALDGGLASVRSRPPVPFSSKICSTTPLPPESCASKRRRLRQPCKSEAPLAGDTLGA